MNTLKTVNINGVDYALSSFEKITYNDLKAKRNARELVPGRFYRITNYRAPKIKDTCSFLHTNQTSDFDIIVNALSYNTLSEVATVVTSNNTNSIASNNTISDYINITGFSYKDVITTTDQYFMTNFNESSMIISDIRYLPHPDTKVLTPALYGQKVPRNAVVEPGEEYRFDIDYLQPYYFCKTMSIDGNLYDVWQAYTYGQDCAYGGGLEAGWQVEPFKSGCLQGTILTNHIIDHFEDIFNSLQTFKIDYENVKLEGYFFNENKINKLDYESCYDHKTINGYSYCRMHKADYWVPCLYLTNDTPEYINLIDFLQPYLYIETLVIDGQTYDKWIKYEGNTWTPDYEMTDVNFATILTNSVVSIKNKHSGYSIKYTLDDYNRFDTKFFDIDVAETSIFKKEITSINDIHKEGILVQDSIDSSYAIGDELVSYQYKNLPNTNIPCPVLYKTDSDYPAEPDYNDVYYWYKKIQIDGKLYDIWSKYEVAAGDWTSNLIDQKYGSKAFIVTNDVVDSVSANRGLIYDFIDNHNNHFKFDAENIKFIFNNKPHYLLGDNCYNNNIEADLGAIKIINMTDNTNNNICNIHVYHGIKGGTSTLPKVIQVPENNDTLLEFKPANAKTVINPAPDINYYWNERQMSPFQGFYGTTKELFNILSQGGIDHKWTDMSSFFESCDLVETVPNIDTINVIYMGYMFSYCSSLIAIPTIDTSKVIDMQYMFSDCASLTTIPQLNTSKVTNMDYMFEQCVSLTTIPLLDTSKVANMRGMFTNCDSLATIPLLDTSSVTDMGEMFYHCDSLTTIPQLDTSNVTDMSWMFSVCHSLITIPQLDTSKVTYMSYMFESCYSLTSVPLLDTSNVTDMSWMFFQCNSLTTIPQLDTSKVTDMRYMFYGGHSLTSVPALDCLKAKYMNGMFQLCTSLKEIHMKNINANLSISDTILEHAALIEVISNLMPQSNPQTPSKTLTLGPTLKAKLSSEEIKVATDKGWTIA